MEPRVSVPCSQKPTTDYYPNPTNYLQVLTSCLLVTHFKNIFPSTFRFSLEFVTKILCIFNVYPMPTHIIILDLNTLYLVRTSAFELSHHTVFFSCCLCVSSLHPDILFTVLFSNTISDMGYVNHLGKTKVLVEKSYLVALYPPKIIFWQHWNWIEISPFRNHVWGGGQSIYYSHFKNMNALFLGDFICRSCVSLLTFQQNQVFTQLPDL